VIAIVRSELMTIRKSCEFGTEISMTSEWVIATRSEWSGGAGHQTRQPDPV
jgi:hypothetical protein